MPAHPPAPDTASARAPLVIAAALLLAGAGPAAAHAAGGWMRPVAGEVARPFDFSPAEPFAAGVHRGADLAAPSGAPVRSACGGIVVHAGAVVRHGRVVTVRCGGRRVTYMPLSAVTVHRGARVTPGARIGTVAAGHGGLHVGVRRAGDPFGYEDPLARMSGDGAPPSLIVRPPALRRPPAVLRVRRRLRRPLARRAPRRRPRSAPGSSPVLAPPDGIPGPVRAGSRWAGPRSSPRLPPSPSADWPAASPGASGARPRSPAPSHGPAPWPVWVGAALVLLGLARRHAQDRRRRLRAGRAAATQPRAVA